VSSAPPHQPITLLQRNHPQPSPLAMRALQHCWQQPHIHHYRLRHSSSSSCSRLCILPLQAPVIQSTPLTTPQQQRQRHGQQQLLCGHGCCPCCAAADVLLPAAQTPWQLSKWQQQHAGMAVHVQQVFCRFCEMGSLQAPFAHM
jgi:hypothetical protein